MLSAKKTGWAQIKANPRMVEKQKIPCKGWRILMLPDRDRLDLNRDVTISRI